MAALPHRSWPERSESTLRFADSPSMPRPELPKALSQRAEHVVDAMRKIEADMSGRELGLDDLQRRQARILHWGEHVHWFAGGDLEQQVSDLKSSLLRFGSKEAASVACELAACTLAGSPEGAQLGLRLIGREPEEREFGRRALLATRHVRVLSGVLEHVSHSCGHLEQRVISDSKHPLLALAAVGELLGPATFEVLDLPGSGIQVSAEQLSLVTPFMAHENPLMRATAARAVAYALQSCPEHRMNADLLEVVRERVGSETEARVRYRLLGIAKYYSENVRGDIILSMVARGDPEIHLPALEMTEGLEHHALATALLKKFQKIIESEALGVPTPVQCAIAKAVRGKLTTPLEGKLREIVLNGAETSGRKLLATYALAGVRDDELESVFFRRIKAAADDLEAAMPVAQCLQVGCREEMQSALAKLAVDPSSNRLTQSVALSALPASTTPAVQRELLAMLVTEDDEAMLNLLVEAFQRFREIAVRQELKELVRKNNAREEGLAAAIEILGKPQDAAELLMLQTQLAEGSTSCRIAAAAALCQGGLNGIDSKRVFALMHEALKVGATTSPTFPVERVGFACNAFLRSTGLL